MKKFMDIEKIRREAEIEAKRIREQGALPIREQLEARRAHLPTFEIIPAPSLKELLERFDVDIEKLPEVIDQYIKNKIEEIKDTQIVAYPSDEAQDLVELLYQINHVSSALPDSLKEWSRHFESFEVFSDFYCADVNDRGIESLAWLAWNIQVFIERVVRPQRRMELVEGGRIRYGRDNRCYLGDGDWILLPEKPEWFDHFDVIDRSVLDEVVTLVREGYREPDFTHATGSVALQKIAEFQAILSSGESFGRGFKVLSGEIARGGRGLSDWRMHASVYVDHGGPRYGYHTLNWFDEYYVTFGINKERQSEFLEKLSLEMKIQSEDEEDIKYRCSIRDLGSEGTLIGSRVPLTSVDIVYCWKRNQIEIKDWAARHAPHVRVVSLEAAEVIVQYENIVANMALQEGIDLVDAWASLGN